MAEIRGTDAGETLSGTEADDRIYGEGGNDVLLASGGNDLLDGGSGDDVFNSSESRPFQPDEARRTQIIRGGGGDDYVYLHDDGQVELGDGNDIVDVRLFKEMAGRYEVRFDGNEIGNGNPYLSGTSDRLPITFNVLSRFGLRTERALTLEDEGLVIRAPFDAIFVDDGTGFFASGASLHFLTVNADVFDASTLSSEYSGTVYVNGGMGDDVLIAGTKGGSFAGGFGNDRLYGGRFIDGLSGGDGHDLLDGGALGDEMFGGGGDDVFFVETSNRDYNRLPDFGQRFQRDSVRERVGDGYDTVYSTVNWRLDPGAEVEVLSTASWAAATPLELRGNEFANRIFGNAGANFLIGDGGVDTLTGFGGDDSYGVDDAADIVVERAGEGYDTVYASANYRLADDASIEVLSAGDFRDPRALDLRGNDGAQLIFGNAGANFLIGGGGADRLTGFGGDDNYGVDQAGDVVVERAGEGYDTVYASGDYGLAAGVSIEVLSAGDFGRTDPLQLLGNELGQLIYGNAGANLLVGGGGADTLFGLGGDDSYGVDQAGDVVVETAGGGYDSVYASADYRLSDDASVEVLSAGDWGRTDPLALTGNRLGNAVFGNAGANTLNGGGGADALTGFGGADRFVFSTALGADNVDRVVDFAVGTDKIVLDRAVFAGLPMGALDAGAFRTGPAAADADDRIVYDPNNGSLFYDADGAGGTAAVRFAILQTGLLLTSADFIVI